MEQMHSTLDSRLSQNTYILRRQFLKMVGARFRIFDTRGSLLFFVNQRGFKLKEEIRVFADEGMQFEMFSIQARQVFDFSGAYDVRDSQSGQPIGMIRRQGFKSMVRDSWLIFDAKEHQVGEIVEDQMIMALLRRFITSLIPQSYHVIAGGTKVAEYKQAFNPFLYRLTLDFGADARGILDRRLGIAAAVLLAAIEGKQSSTHFG